MNLECVALDEDASIVTAPGAALLPSDRGSKMSSVHSSGNRRSGSRNQGPIRIGLVLDEPIRLAGLTSIFDQPAVDSDVQLLPVIGSIKELLSIADLRYVVVDLHSTSSDLRDLGTIRRARPDIRLIVIGPEGNDELVLDAICVGARAYLDHTAGPKTVRQAIEVVTEGSIWAPRKLLSRLIDRLLESSGASAPVFTPKQKTPQLTEREGQVLELIMKANSNREIALKLGIEERTVRAHLARLMRKAGVDNRIKLSMSARSLFQMPQKPAGRTDNSGRGSRSLTR
ncbi:MAG: response regulator transcription factor [Terracidiphilus sp.]